MSQRRVFFALPCSNSEKAALAQWRMTHLRAIRVRWVPQANLHLTLAFIGAIGDDALRQLLELGEHVSGRPFSLHLSRLGQWGRGKVVWLAPNETPPALTELVDSLNRELSTAGMPVDDRAYRPHLTLARKAESPRLPNVQPDIELSIDHYALFESVPTGQGVEYHALKTWPLREAN